jgi:hypothetical protein
MDLLKKVVMLTLVLPDARLEELLRGLQDTGP